MKKLLPPVLFLLLAVLMGGVCWLLGSPHNIAYPFNLIGGLALVGGLGISFYHSRLFRKLGANIMTFDEPTTFVKDGMYRYTRNPMYLGMIVALLGVAVLYQGALSSFIIAAGFLFVTDRWYVRYEEHEMMKKFGAEYEAYCENTPRWV